MKNTLKNLCVIAMIMAIGFSMVACDNGTTSSKGEPGPLDGTWEGVNRALGELVRWTFTGYNWQAEVRINFNYNNLAKGTFEIDGDDITINQTHGVNSSYNWVSSEVTLSGIIWDYAMYIDGSTYTKEPASGQDESSVLTDISDAQFDGTFENISSYGLLKTRWIFDGTNNAKYEREYTDPVSVFDYEKEIVLFNGYLWEREWGNTTYYVRRWMCLGIYSFNEDGSRLTIGTDVFTKQ